MKKIEPLKLSHFIAVFCLLFFCTGASFAIERTELIKLYRAEDIIGSVKDKSGQPIVGANVSIKNGKSRTVTDIDGNFRISGSVGQTIVIDYLGYKTTEVVIEGNSIAVVLEETTNTLSEVVVGSRISKPRSNTERPVAIDVISAKDIQATGQIDLGQALTFSAPSFSAVKFGINDAAPFVDPATLRGLGPDQVLVLVNGKRRHKVSFLSINDGVGKGQVGTDVNAVPALSLKRVEILRDGAAAQYGSDAIAGVINLELNDSNHGGTVSVYTGIGLSTPNLDVTGAIAPKQVSDGFTRNIAANAGFKIAKDGFVNATLFHSHTDGYDRSGTYKASAGYYVKDATADAALVKANNINLDRAILGAPRNTSYGIFVNSGMPISKNFKAYVFGGYTSKEVVAGIFTRPPSNTKRNNLTLFPNGYNPVTPATLQDYSIVGGVKGTLGDWKSDFSLSQSGNRVDWYANNTVNASLGDASPTSFKTGVTDVHQSLLNADLSRSFNKGSYPNLSLGLGTELRRETYQQIAGDEASYIAGPLRTTKEVGSNGREGFGPATAGKWNRTNVGVYAELESDITKAILVGAAIRGENYSDFGNDFTSKVNSRIKIIEQLSVRGSYSRGFRAPSITQVHYSNYANVSFDNAGNSITNPVIPSNSFLASKLGVTGLQKETSHDFSAGLTSRINKNFSLTADVYQIDVYDRIILSGGVDVSKIPEFVAAGYSKTANVFVNALDTRTRGLEIVGSYKGIINDNNKIDVNVSYANNETSMLNRRKTATGTEVVDDYSVMFITRGQPREKLISTLNYTYKKFGLMLRGSYFGEVTDPIDIDKFPTDKTVQQVFSGKTLFDVSVSAKILKNITVIAAVNNLTDVYPDLLRTPQTANEVVYSRRTNQFGTQGRFMNLTVNYSF